MLVSCIKVAATTSEHNLNLLQETIESCFLEISKQETHKNPLWRDLKRKDMILK